MKKLLIISIFLIAVLSFSAVSAQANSTDTTDISQDSNDEIPIEEPAQKRDLNATIHYVDEAAKYAVLNDYYYLSIDGVSYDDSVELYIDGNYRGIYENYGMGYELWPTKFSLGEHVITAKFNGNEKYNPFTINHTFKVVKVAITIPDEITPQNNNVMIRIGDGATGTATVYVNNTKYKTVNIKQDESTRYADYVSLSGLKFGTYDIKVVYSGDKKYPKTTKTKRVSVSYYFDAILDKGYYPNNGDGYIYLPIDVKKAPIVKIEGKLFNVTKFQEYKDEKEVEYRFNYGDLAPGYHEAEITYPGDSKYPAKTIKRSVYIDTAIQSIGYYQIPVNETKYVILYLPDDAKGNLTVNLNDELYESVKPNTPVKFANLSVGKYYIECIYTGDDYYVDRLWTSIEVTPIFKYPSSMTYGDNETCFVDFLDNVTANITYNYNNQGRTLEIINGKGNFSLAKVNLYRDYGYKSPIEFYCPTKNGNILSCEINVPINPIPSKLVGGKDITMFYDDGSTYSLTVWGDYGKIVGANQVVSIKIGSKTYKVKTDANGKATLKITELPGKYTITATYHGAKVTNKLTVKQTITLKTVTVKKSAKKLDVTATLKGKSVLKNKQVTFKFNGKTYTTKTNSKGIAKITVSKSVLSKLKVGKKVTYQVTYLKNTVKKTVTVKK